MTDATHNAANEAQVKKRQQKAKDVAEQQQADLKALLQLAEFRRYVWRLIGERCGLLVSPGSNNGTIQSWNIGRSDVARELWAEIEAVDPLAIPQMMRETWEAAQKQ